MKNPCGLIAAVVTLAASASLFAFQGPKDSAPASPPVPARIEIHEFSSRRVGIVTVHYGNIAHLTWNGRTFDGDWEGVTNDKNLPKGATSTGNVTMTRVGDVVTLERTDDDKSGPPIHATYTGTVSANDTAEGHVTYRMPDNKTIIVSGTWNATLTMTPDPPRAQSRPEPTQRAQSGTEQAVAVPSAVPPQASSPTPIQKPGGGQTQGPREPVTGGSFLDMFPLPASVTDPLGQGFVNSYVGAFPSLFNHPPRELTKKEDRANGVAALRTIANMFGAGSGQGKVEKHVPDLCVMNLNHVTAKEAAAKASAAMAAKDSTQVACWLGVAARQGDAEAQVMYGNIFFNFKDYPHASLYWQMAGRQGNKQALKQLIDVYTNSKNTRAAEYWSSSAAVQPKLPCDENNPTHISGDEAVTRALGAAKNNDENVGLCWLWIGAAQGNAKALYLLGLVNVSEGDEVGAYDVFLGAAQEDHYCSEAILMMLDSRNIGKWSQQVAKHPGGRELVAAYDEDFERKKIERGRYEDLSRERQRAITWNDQAAENPARYARAVVPPRPIEPAGGPPVLPGCMPDDVKNPKVSAL